MSEAIEQGGGSPPASSAPVGGAAVRSPSRLVVFEPGVLPVGVGPEPLQAFLPGLPSASVVVRSAFPPDLLGRLRKRGIDLLGVAPPDQIYLLSGAPALHLEHVSRVLVGRGQARFSWPRPRFARPPGDPDVAWQGYLTEPDPSSPPVDHAAKDPWGVGATAVEELPGALGGGVRVLVVERGWHLAGQTAAPQGHPDLDGAAWTLETGTNAGGDVDWTTLGDTAWTDPDGGPSRSPRDDRDHGLAGLGILGARLDNKMYGRGICPQASFRLHSSHDPAAPLDGAVHEALMEVILDAQRGDIVLIEEQLEASHADGTKRNCMIERDPLVMIQLYHLCEVIGATVIEPAGNGRADLADLSIDFCGRWRGELSAYPARPIVVGGARPRSRVHDTECNHGARVDLFAWSNKVHRLKLTDVASAPYPDWGTDFTGTSSAAAIIAGAAAAAQGMYLHKHGVVAGPEALRNLLAGSSGATLNLDASVYPIGRMPNLGGVAEALGL